MWEQVIALFNQHADAINALNQVRTKDAEQIMQAFRDQYELIKVQEHRINELERAIVELQLLGGK